MKNYFTLILVLFIGTYISAQVDITDVSPTCSDEGSISLEIDPQSIAALFGSYTYPLHLRWYNTNEQINETMLIYSEDELDIVLQNLPSGEWDIILTVDVFCTFETVVEVEGYDLHDDLEHTLLNATGDCNNGSIDLELNEFFEPLQYSWSNGQTTQDISGLSEGIYCVTIVDEHCGPISECFEVSCQCFAASPNVVANTLGSGDVYYSISIPDFSDISGWVTLNVLINGTVSNTTSLTGPTSNFNTANLKIGDHYCFEFVSNPGSSCNFDICGIVEGQSCPDKLSISLNKIENSCTLDKTGSISTSIDIKTIDDIPCGDYLGIQSTWYDADDGSVVSSTFTLDGVAAGTYCQELRSPDDCAEDCITVACFDVGVKGPPILDVVIEQPYYCLNQFEQIGYLFPGSITIDPIDGGSLDVDWYFEGEYVSSGLSIDVPLLDAGTYCMISTDQCLGEVQNCYEVTVDPVVRERCPKDLWIKRLAGISDDEIRATLRDDHPHYQSVYQGRDLNWTMIKIENTDYFELFDAQGISTLVALEPRFIDIQKRESLSHSQPNSITNLNVFPSPFTDILTIEYDSSLEGNAIVTLTNLDGRLIYSQSVESTVGKNSKALSLQNLEYQGVLLLEITQNGMSTFTKVVKM